MSNKNKDILGCCKVEAVVSVDERGQMVLPKEVREKAQIRAGDKLTLVTGKQKGKTCCIALIKAAKLEETIKGILNSLGK